MANILRFVILGDDKGGPAFAQFAKQVERANASVDRNNAALKRQSATAKDARGGIASLAGEVTGFGAAADAAGSRGNTFRLALAGINLASGVLEPALAGVVVAAGGLAAGFAAAGAGIGVFGAVAKSVFTEASKGATAYAAAQAKYSSATTSAQRVAALQAEKAAFAGMSPAVRTLAVELGTVQGQWKKFTDAAAPGVVSVISQGLGMLPKILASMQPFLAPVEKALHGILTQLNTGLSSSGFKSFIDLLAKNTGPAITKIAAAIGNVVVGIGGILRAFMPVSQQMLTGVDKITAKFREWGTTLSGGTGFQSLMTTFRTETPQAMAILTNLGTVIANVGKAMFGLSTFSNSRLLLDALTPLSGVMASLSKNTDLVRVAMYALLAVKIGQQFTWIPAAAASLVAFAGAAEGATVAQIIAAAATRAWGIAMMALPWVALAAAVVAVAVLIIKYHTQIWAFMQKVWHDILAVIMACWTWVKTNWPLLLAIITGPIGLAILWVVQNFGKITAAVQAVLSAVQAVWNAVWGAIRAAFAVFISAGVIAPFNTITGAIRTVLGAVSSAWNATWNTLKAAFRVFVVDGILGPLGLIINGAAAAFGWVPGLGGKLKTAAAAFNTFRANVNAALGGINGRTVNVSVAMTSSTNPYPGGISGRAASGMYVASGRSGVDDQLILAQRGELVVPTRMVKAGAVDHLRGRIPGFASGGPVGVNVAPHTPAAAAITSTLMASVTKLAQAFAKAAQAAAATAGGPGGPGGGAGVARWASVILQALAMLGQPASWLNTVERRMNQESGGNATIVNKWDSNWLAGHPSVGLMQVIAGTFASYAGRFRNTGPFEYGVSVNPLANVYAGLNYAIHQYGSLSALNRPGGYDSGGLLMPGWTMAFNGTGRPETVLPPGGQDGLLAELRALRAEVRQLTGVAAGIPAATGHHVGGAINSSAGAAGFRRRYPQGGA